MDLFQALDLWMAGCMISVFAALGEFVITKVLYGKYNEIKRKEAEHFQVSTKVKFTKLCYINFFLL